MNNQQQQQKHSKQPTKTTTFKTIKTINNNYQYNQRQQQLNRWCHTITCTTKTDVVTVTTSLQNDKFSKNSN